MDLRIPLWLRWIAALACCGVFLAAAYAGAGDEGSSIEATPQPVEFLSDAPEAEPRPSAPSEELLVRGVLGPGSATTRPTAKPSASPSPIPRVTTPPAPAPRTTPNRPTATPSPPVPKPPTVTQLSSLEPFSAVSGWGPYERNTSNGEAVAGDGRTMSIRGVTYATGLGVHAFSSLKYRLDGRYTEFRAVIGIDDETCNDADVRFVVVADGTTVHSSPILTRTSAAVPVKVRMTGVQVLELMVLHVDDDGVNVIGCDHANWADARLLG